MRGFALSFALPLTFVVAVGGQVLDDLILFHGYDSHFILFVLFPCSLCG